MQLKMLAAIPRIWRHPLEMEDKMSISLALMEINKSAQRAREEAIANGQDPNEAEARVMNQATGAFTGAGVGLMKGAAVGALVGGPVGAVVGGIVGLFGGTVIGAEHPTATKVVAGATSPIIWNK